MRDPETVWLFATTLALCLANVPLLWLPPSRGEQRLWRRLRVQAFRKWLTRRRPPSHTHRAGDTVGIARTNILWHLVLGAVFATLTINPWFIHGPLRYARYLLLMPSAAYFLGSIVQRQKMVVAMNERTRRTADFTSGDDARAPD